MSRPSKGPRLYFRKRKGSRNASYVIRDGQSEFSTGTSDRKEAEAALRSYLIQVETPREFHRGDRANMRVSELLAVYGDEHAIRAADPERIAYAIDALDDWFGNMLVSEINIKKCIKYAENRNVKSSTVRRELSCLRAAINYVLPKSAAKPELWLPELEESCGNFITRSQAARLIRIARRDKKTRHLAKFILIGVYTGTRKTNILQLKFHPHSHGGWIDIENNLIYRKKSGSRRTKKRAPTVRIPPKLLVHLRIWEKNNQSGWVIEFRGKGVKSIKTSWSTLRENAKLPAVTPHTLRHTAITWALQSGAPKWEACGYFGLTMDTLEQVYGHHHPDHQASVLEAMNRGGRGRK
ncbi:tyrosine-type recombinase/integrase [Rhodovulum sp. YNF3179]|uniref:tyrosine-type recombinase/integrase n=1 Tax=Rhodovulum sp. YNF3179 TaxID=3425127 RepID=UPI003D342C67